MNPFLARAVSVLLALAVIPAIAEAQSGSKRPRDRNVLAVEEIRAAPLSTVYDLVRSKRPRWLSIRGSSTLRTVPGRDIVNQPTVFAVEAEIAVYFDGVRVGSQDVLRSLPTTEVESIEYLDAASATQRLGTDHEYGAILIRRRAH